MSQYETTLHPFNVGHVLTDGDVASIDDDRMTIAKLVYFKSEREREIEQLKAVLDFIAGHAEMAHTLANDAGRLSSLDKIAKVAKNKKL